MDITKLLMIIEFNLGYGLGKENFWAGFYMLIFLSLFLGIFEAMEGGV